MRVLHGSVLLPVGEDLRIDHFPPGLSPPIFCDFDASCVFREGGVAVRPTLGQGPDPMDESEILRRLDALRLEHRDLDAAIEALGALALSDQMQIARLKKRKLRLRDEITQLEDQLIPDIIA